MNRYLTGPAFALAFLAQIGGAQADPAASLGVVSFPQDAAGNGQIMFDMAPSAQPGDAVTLLFVDPVNQSIALRLQTLGTTAENGTAFELPEDAALVGRVGLAVLGGISSLDVVEGVATVQVPGLETPAVLSACLTSEGVQLALTSGEEQVWEGYAGLGYDVEPTCQDLR